MKAYTHQHRSMQVVPAQHHLKTWQPPVISRGLQQKGGKRESPLILPGPRCEVSPLPR